MRRSHILRGNKNVEMPHDALWFDTETNPVDVSPTEIKHVLKFGYAASMRRLECSDWSQPTWYRFSSRAEFWDFVESRLHGKCKIVMFCHNAAFDLPVLNAFEILPHRGWQLTHAVIDSPPVICKWRRGNQSIQVIDTLNIWRMPLEQVGLGIGLAKLKFPDEHASPEYWEEYARRDVEIIMAACLQWWQFLQRHDLGGFAATLASQALRAYRHRFMSHPILIDDDTDALGLSRDSYHGGRVECFRLGEINEPMTLLDVNSMYPAVMRDNVYPYRLIAHTSHLSVKDLRHWLDRRSIIARVRLSTEVPVYPLVHDHRLVFPIGEFTTTLCTPELRYALDHGHVVSVDQAAVYEHGEIFREFVDTLYGLRMDAQARGNAPEVARLKTLMNSLYGKFGQSGRHYDEDGQTTDLSARSWVELDADTGTIYKHRQLGGLLQVYRDEGESRDSMPAIASHVTAYARLRLWELIVRAGRENVYYIDTDSLLVSQTGLVGLSRDLGEGCLGLLKVERTFNSAALYGPKDYRFGEIVKIKGISRKAERVGDASFKQEQWSSLIGLLAIGDLSAPRTRRITKNLSRNYTKGQVLPDGRVLPLRLD